MSFVHRNIGLGIFTLLLACNDNLLVQKSSEKEGDQVGECSDNIDNDEDGYLDCADQDCLASDECEQGIPDTAIVDTGTDTAEDSGIDTEEPSDIDNDGYSVEDGDCNDNDSSVYPGAEEIPDDGIDNDCADGDLITVNEMVYDVAGEYSFIVPSNISTIEVQMWGGGGAGGSQTGAHGGGGGFIAAILSVTPNTEYTLYVGQGGQNFGQGAGASFLLEGAEALLIAGGGGGGASDGNSGNSWTGGAGGAGGQFAEAGQGLLNGPTYPYCTSATGGTGATPSTPGIGGIATGTASFEGVSRICEGLDGSQYQGGGTDGDSAQCQKIGPNMWQASGSGSNGHGGAGGAGYFGGGGGGAVYTYCGAGGGGGSSWITQQATGPTYQNGMGQTEGNSSNSQGSGHGGTRQLTTSGIIPKGNDGRILIRW